MRVASCHLEPFLAKTIGTEDARMSEPSLGSGNETIELSVITALLANIFQWIDVSPAFADRAPRKSKCFPFSTRGPRNPRYERRRRLD